MFDCLLEFDETLKGFLYRRLKGGNGPIRIQRSQGNAPVKDLIESCGIPHPLVDGIIAGDQWVDFDYVPQSGELIRVGGVWNNRPGLGGQNTLQIRSQEYWHFVLDGHLGKLARYMRLLGFDSWYEEQVEDDRLIEVMIKEKRILVTRDRQLLMRQSVCQGYCPVSDKPLDQLKELFARFDLLPAVNPYSRCLLCNGLLNTVQKEEILDSLEPLTKIHYQDFARCEHCRRVYWEGSHSGNLDKVIAAVTG